MPLQDLVYKATYPSDLSDSVADGFDWLAMRLEGGAAAFASDRETYNLMWIGFRPLYPSVAALLPAARTRHCI